MCYLVVVKHYSYMIVHFLQQKCLFLSRTRAYLYIQYPPSYCTSSFLEFHLRFLRALLSVKFSPNINMFSAFVTTQVVKHDVWCRSRNGRNALPPMRHHLMQEHNFCGVWCGLLQENPCLVPRRRDIRQKYLLHVFYHVEM